MENVNKAKSLSPSYPPALLAPVRHNLYNIEGVVCYLASFIKLQLVFLLILLKKY